MIELHMFGISEKHKKSLVFKFKCLDSTKTDEINSRTVYRIKNVILNEN